MNKSLEYVNKQLSELGKATLKKEDISIYRLSAFLKNKVELPFTTPVKLNISDILIDLTIELTEAPENFENFDCCGYHGEHNDGTAIFILRGIEEILNNFLSLRRCPSSKIQTEEDLVGVKKIKIMAGDVVVSQQEDKSPVAEKPWMTNKLEVFIPAYFELIKE